MAAGARLAAPRTATCKITRIPQKLTEKSQAIRCTYGQLMAPVELSLSMPGHGIAPPVSCGIGPCQPGGAPCLRHAPVGPMHQLPARTQLDQLVTLAKAAGHKNNTAGTHIPIRGTCSSSRNARNCLRLACVQPCCVGVEPFGLQPPSCGQKDPCQWVRRAVLSLQVSYACNV